jgi:superfamily II DNA/RNA helicase
VVGITRVVNFDPPHDEQAYTHRVGRTGRAGADGVGVTLVLGGEERDVAQWVRLLDLPAGTEHGPLAARVSARSANGHNGHNGGNGRHTGNGGNRNGGGNGQRSRRRRNRGRRYPA